MSPTVTNIDDIFKISYFTNDHVCQACPYYCFVKIIIFDAAFLLTAFKGLNGWKWSDVTHKAPHLAK